MRQGWSQTGSTPCGTRTQDTSLLSLSLFTMWPMHTYYKMRSDMFKSAFCLVYRITCLFLIEGKSCPVIDNPRSRAWYIGVPFTMFQGINCRHNWFPDFSVQLAFSWVFQKKKKMKHFFFFNFIFNNNNKPRWVAENILRFISKCQSTKKRSFSLELFKLNKYSCLDGAGRVLSSEQKCT